MLEMIPNTGRGAAGPGDLTNPGEAFVSYDLTNPGEGSQGVPGTYFPRWNTNSSYFGNYSQPWLESVIIRTRMTHLLTTEITAERPKVEVSLANTNQIRTAKLLQRT